MATQLRTSKVSVQSTQCFVIPFFLCTLNSSFRGPTLSSSARFDSSSSAQSNHGITPPARYFAQFL